MFTKIKITNISPLVKLAKVLKSKNNENAIVIAPAISVASVYNTPRN